MAGLCFPDAGDIVWLSFDPQVGREQAGHRPAVVLSPAVYNAKTSLMVHPGPPFKSPVNTRRFSLFAFRGISLKKPICQLFANFRIGRMALHSGALRPFG